MELTPTCFGEYPTTPQARAENDCYRCGYATQCIEYTGNLNQIKKDMGQYMKQATNPLDQQVGGNHYKDLKIQPVEYIHANNIGYMEGNVIKYVSRWRAKNGIKDLEKAKHYIELLIQLETQRGEDA